MPLAPLTNVPDAEEELRGLVRHMAERINAEPEPRAAKLWTATYLLMGLRFSKELASRLLEGVQNMRESTTYQAILTEGRNEGRVGEAQRMLLMLGETRFGEPDEATRGAVKAILDVERLERMTKRQRFPEEPKHLQDKDLCVHYFAKKSLSWYAPNIRP